jgi:arylformamidase
VSLLASSMDWIDISAAVCPETAPIFPDDPPVHFRWAKQIAKGDKDNLSAMDMGLHTLTHVDAPLHFVENGTTIDEVPISKLIGPARVISIDVSVDVIDAAELCKHDLVGVKRILFRTRASTKNWLYDREFHRDYTGIAPDAARKIVEAGIDLVGVDYLSAEQFQAKDAPTHKTLLGNNVLIVEGLDLRNVTEGDYTLIVLPLKLAGREAAPARALLQRRS